MLGYKEQLAITDRNAKKIRKAYLDSIKSSISATNWSWVAENVPRGYESVYNAISWNQWSPLPYIASAYKEVIGIQKEVLRYEDFALSNPEAESWLLRYAAQELVGITENTKQAIRNILVEGQRDKLTNDQTATRIKSRLGLTDGQESAVEKYRNALLKGGMKEERAEKLANKYYQKLLKYRAETIALTESHTATSRAFVDKAKDAKSRGVLTGYHFEWLTTPDDRLCPVCMSMNRKRGDIESGGVDGGQMTPKHARCRCTLLVVRD